MRSRRRSPATVLAGLALFFALGGSALAVSHAVRPQPRCTTGAVRGIAAVTGGTSGVANIPGDFTSTKSLFTRTFNCGGGATEVRRVGLGVYEVRFVGNGAATAVVGGAGSETWVTPLPGGVFQVGLHRPGRDDHLDTNFVLVAV